MSPMFKHWMAVAIAACGMFLLPVAHAEKKLTSVGMTVGVLGNPFFSSLAKGATDEARKLGGPDVKVTVLAHNWDVSKQVSQIENFIASKVDMIVVDPADPKALTPVLAKARAAGITVVALDDASEGVQYTIMADSVAAGRNSCEYLARQIGNKGNVILISGPPVTTVFDRINGCKEALAKHPDIKILSDDQDAKGTREGALQVTQDLLTRFPKVDAIYNINDQCAIGSLLAVKQARRTGIILTSVDGSPEAVSEIKKPNSIFVASSAQDPNEMGKNAIEVGYGIMNGKVPAQTLVLMPTPVVTKETASTYVGWKPL
jgi:ribose transport system substrate-binding protein